ncbi:hypothetical protein IFR05_015238 [Cadophora sp. M221]|nr:hypothetical protein IFR05_015238 [Cadophora sp. M221]
MTTNHREKLDEALIRPGRVDMSVEFSLVLAEEKAAEATATLALKKIEEAKLEKLGEEFAALIPTVTFSPAEIQGYLLKHKRDPEGALLEVYGST